MTIRDSRSSNYKNLMRLARSTIEIKVGIMGTEASMAHLGSENTVADVAGKHEFGIGVPQRSFIRETFDVKKSEIRKMISDIKKIYVRNKNIPMEQVGDLIGLKLQSIFVERIANDSPPFEPLSEMTVELKGSSKPLVNTGQLKASITYTAEVKGRGDG